MASTSSRPTAFVSSTISDFLDLRGALKFWLEEGGFEVCMSEYNDMQRPAAANTFNACFESIRRADFYILLIGERRGSLYSAADGVSVTQQEYRVAYESYRAQGRPIPLLFVRSSVMDMLRGWRSGGMSGQPPFPDAAFVASFIDEVERVRETRDAVDGLVDFPLANWLERFSDFRGIVDALRVALSLKVDVPLQRVLGGMILDLEMTLAGLVEMRMARFSDEALDYLRDRLSTDDMTEAERNDLRESLRGQRLRDPRPGHTFMTPVIEAVPLNEDDDGPVRLNSDQRRGLAFYLFGAVPPPDRIWLNSVRQAVSGGSLLRYDPSTRSLQDTDLSNAAAELLTAATDYETVYRIVDEVRPIGTSYKDELVARIRMSNSRHQPTVTIPRECAVFVWALHHRQANLFRRVASLRAYIKGQKADPFPESLFPRSPFGAEMEERIREESATRADIQAWFEIPHFWNV
ncbi:MAG: DUF4062 domain-containing protein [Chloroflexi bacterium]|nr:DUF4062 domain-containing protein [Chloroflexota bacterium]